MIDMNVAENTCVANDADLLAAWRQSRDESAFQFLCDRNATLVTAACRRLGSPDTEEAAQAVFILLAQRPGAVGAPDRLGGWLLGSTRRIVANQRRIARRRRHHEQEAAMAYAQQRRIDANDGVWMDALPLLDDALAELSTKRREAVVRFYLEDRPQCQIAIELGCSVDAVKMRVHEGLDKLRRALAWPRGGAGHGCLGQRPCWRDRGLRSRNHPLVSPRLRDPLNRPQRSHARAERHNRHDHQACPDRQPHSDLGSLVDTRRGRRGAARAERRAGAHGHG
jgi:RNA polymerase sigma factor (sigma-70 family)